MRHDHPRYTHYFGKVFIRALVACAHQHQQQQKHHNTTSDFAFNGKQLCADAHKRSEQVDIGILNSRDMDDSSKVNSLVAGKLLE